VEVRKKDVDLPALKKLGLAAAGVNERGRRVAVFEFLPDLVRKF